MQISWPYGPLTAFTCTIASQKTTKYDPVCMPLILSSKLTDASQVKHHVTLNELHPVILELNCCMPCSLASYQAN